MIIVLTVTTVGHVGDDPDDLLAGGRLARVAHDQQLHDAVIDGPGKKGISKQSWKRNGSSYAYRGGGYLALVIQLVIL